MREMITMRMMTKKMRRAKGAIPKKKSPKKPPPKVKVTRAWKGSSDKTDEHEVSSKPKESTGRQARKEEKL